MNTWEPTFTIHGGGDASPEAQVKYLSACLAIARDEVATKSLQMQTLKLEVELELAKLSRERVVLYELQHKLKVQLGQVKQVMPGLWIEETPAPVKRKRWWRREARN